MKITAQEEYGLRCLVQLAKLPEGQLMSVKAIAEKEGLSSANVEKLLRLLAKADLVRSVRGINGGYILNKPAEAIRLSDVVRALGTLPNTKNICESYTGKHDACVHVDECGIRSVWSSLTLYIQYFLDRTSLALLLEPEQNLTETMLERFGALPEQEED